MNTPLPSSAWRGMRSLATLAVPFTLVCAAPALAQWSHDPAVNLGVSTDPGDQNQAKLGTAPDGSTWVVWLDGISTGWDTVVQRLAPNGIKLLPGNGVIVADTAFSSTQDYGFAVDDEGRAVVAYRDDANSGAPVQIVVQRVALDGTLEWGDGVQVSTVAGGNSPHCCVTSDGGAVVAWSNTMGGAQVQKVDAKGNVVWTAGGVTDAPAAGLYFVCDVASDGDGGAIVLYHHQTGGFSSPRHLKAQRFGAEDGAKLWNDGSPLVIFDGGSLQLGAFPALVPDGEGGIVTAWYDVSGTRNAYVQHVTADGEELFPHNGVAIAENVPNRIRISAAADIDEATGDIYMVARESNAAPQGNYNIIAQRINSSGKRVWADTGVELIPKGADQPSFEQVQAVEDGGGAVFAWYNGTFNNQHVFTTRLDAKSATLWDTTASTADSGKARLTSVTNPETESIILAWADNRNDGNDIYAQRVNLDGFLGTPGDVNDDGIVNGVDLGLLLGAWGPCPAFCAADLNVDGEVNGIDLGILLGGWTP